jgi:hypothetical protein
VRDADEDHQAHANRADDLIVHRNRCLTHPL